MDKTRDEAIALRLKSIRIKERISLRRQSELVGLSHNTIWKMEAGTIPVNEVYLLYLSNKGYSTQWVLHGVGPKMKDVKKKDLLLSIGELHSKLDIANERITKLEQDLRYFMKKSKV